MPDNLKLGKIFAVVDPNDDQHVAVERALLYLKNPTIDTDELELFIFIGVDSGAINAPADKDNLFRDQDWLETVIINPLKESGARFKIGFSWSLQWQETIALEAKRFGAQAIYLPLHKQVNKARFTLRESKWDLMKQANCPVVLIRPGATEERNVVLAAVNFQASKAHQQELNLKVLDRAKTIASSYGADLHIVNAYQDFLYYPDRGKLANESGLDSSKIHVEQGYTNEVVAAVAKKINADLLVMGTLNQVGTTKTIRGNTAERVIAGMDIDTVVIN